jgi:indole-3-glycerol phosphate synthase
VCAECKLGYIVEVHTVEEIEKALSVNARVIGINNRDLGTLEIDLKVTETLMQHIPKTTYAVSESGIQSVADVRKARAAGVRGILVGASILKAENPREYIATLKNALQ